MGQYKDRPSLHQAATLSGIPGKIGVSGSSVAEMWLQGKLSEIVAYNEFDAFTTHLFGLVWLIFRPLSSDQYAREQDRSGSCWRRKFQAAKFIGKIRRRVGPLVAITGQTSFGKLNFLFVGLDELWRNGCSPN